MSQYGAKALAELGYDYQKILQYYYKDVRSISEDEATWISNNLTMTCRKSLIAQTPLADRSSSRLMTLNKLTGEDRPLISSAISFRFVKPGDVLVLNDTRVIPARLIGRKTGGGAMQNSCC